METTRSNRIAVVLAAVLLFAVVGGGWTVIRADLRARAHISELAAEVAPASVLLLNLDRDAYQAQLFLERVVQLEAAGLDATAERAFHNDNMAQLVGDRWARFRAIGIQLGEKLPGESDRIAMFESDRGIWSHTVAEVAAAKPGPARDAVLARSKSDFESMRHHLDVLEEEFYEPLAESLGRSAVRRIDVATIVVGIVLSAAAAMTIVLTALSAMTLRRQDRSHRAREDELLETSRRQLFETQLRRALEMAADESAAVSVIERATTQEIDEFDLACLLILDPGQSHLRPVYRTGSASECGVSSPRDCRAVATGSMQTFHDSAALDSCPYLTERDDVPRMAMCAPVSINGRSAGVIHVTRARHDRFNDGELSALSTIADHGGIRLSVIRNDAVISMQARTDPLTGLDNRRSFENKVRTGTVAGSMIAALMIDLDHFKALNDTHGHEAGDQALRLFADALRDVTTGTRSLVARWGGEEFVIALMDAEMEDGSEMAQNLRDALAVRLIDGSVPLFTISIGVAAASTDESLAGLIAQADRALYRAKRSGRDCVAFASE